MDIKGIFNNINPLQLRSKDNVSKALKLDSATDRDGDGQMSRDPKKEQDKKPPMSEDQFSQALDNLRLHPVIQEHGFGVEPFTVDGKRFAVLKDHLDQIIRKIPEIELWTALESPDSERGQLLRKSA